PSFPIFSNATATTVIYTLSLHDALPISSPRGSRSRDRLERVFADHGGAEGAAATRSGRYWARTSDPQLVDSGQAFASVRRRSLRDRKSTRLNSSHRTISYAVFCLKKKSK